MWKAAFSGRSEKGSSTSQRKKASGTESGVSTSSRKAEDERQRSEKSRGSIYDDETAEYEDAATSRDGERRALTESAVNLLNEDAEDEGWEDDEDKDARSERRSVKSDGRRRRHRSEKERSRSRSREHKSDRKSKSSRQATETSRGKEHGLEGEDRAIPDMGSFEQFPGQYAGGKMGDAGKQEFMMSGAVSSSADNQFGLTRADTFGAAADYYQDEGQSVSQQPGYRTKSPNMLVNPDQHLMAASATEQPAQDTGHGSAADFYAGKVSPVPFDDQSGNPARQSSGSSKPGKGRTNSLGTTAASSAAIGAAGMAVGAKITQSQSQSQSHYQSSSSRPPRRPSRQNSEPVLSGSSSTYYAPPPQNSNTSGKQPSTNSHAGLYTAGAAAAAGAAALAGYEMYEHHEHQQQQQNGHVAPNQQYGGVQYGTGSSYGRQGGPSSNGNTMYSQPFHEHKGPMTRLKDGFLNLLASEEDVVKMEMYTEYIGVCKYCFDPRTSPTDAPRVHHYHASSRNDSFEDLRKRRSIERMRKSSREGLNGTGSNRIDKDSRYYSTDTAKRRKSTDKVTLVGAGLAAAGAAAGASMLLNDGRKDFDDTYSVKSGHRESSAVRRRSRSSSREMRRKSSHGIIDPGTKEEYVTVRTKDGRFEKRKVKQRSRSSSKERRGSLAATAAGAAIGASTVAAASSRHGRQRSPKRSRRSRSSSRDRQQQGFFGGIFSPSRKEKKRRDSRTERRKKQGVFFNFGNGSISSSDNDLAFGASRTDLSLRRKSSTKQMKKKSSDEHIAATVAGIGVTAAALAAAQNGRRVNQRNSGVELGARRDTKTTPITGPANQHASSEEDWEDEQELPSDVDDATSAEGDLAFGDYDRRKLSKRQSMESVGSQSSGGGFLGWKWGRKDKRQRRRPSKPTSSYSPRTNGSYMGSAAAAGAAAGAVGSRLDRAESAVTSSSSIPQRPMQEIDPRPMSEAGSVSGSRHASIPGGFDSYQPSSRPGPAPIQQPKPITPIKPSFTESPPEIDARDAPRPTPRRTQSSPTQSGNFEMQDAALIGAAALGTAGIIAAAGRKSKEPSNVRFGLTEEQERKHERELQRERERSEDDRQRADRERKLKDEATRYTREQDVLRAREAENRKAAEAKLESERAAQREAEEQAEEYRRREREHQEREDAYKRERARREEEDRRRRERDEMDRRQREKDEDERRERDQYEADRRRREQDEADRRQREQHEQRDVSDHDRYSREQDRDQHRESRDRQDYDRRATDGPPDSSISWGAVAAGAAAAGAGAYAVHEYDQRKQRDRDEQRDYQARNEPAERRGSYKVQEVKPPEERRSNDDDDYYNAEYYRRGTRRQSDYARHMELARKAASKVVATDQVFAENKAAYDEPAQTQAEFFAPEELSRKAEGKEKSSDPIGDNEVSATKSPDEEHRESFKREWAVSPQPRSRYAPYGVPKLDLVSPTPPPSATSFRRRRSTEPSPLTTSAAEEFRDASDVSKSSPRRSISWGVDQTHVYDAPTPEADHEAESYVEPRDVSTAGAAAMRRDDESTDVRDQKIAEEDDKSNAATLYKQPSYESVSDIHLPRTTQETPGREDVAPIYGSVEGEGDEPSVEEERRPHIHGGFDDDDDYDVERDAAPAATKRNVRDTRNIPKAENQDNEGDRDAVAARSTEELKEGQEEQSIKEEQQTKPKLERKLSKKERRKLEKAAKRGETVDDDQPAPSAEDAVTPRDQPESSSATESSQQRDASSKKQSFADIAGAVMTTGGVAAMAAGSNADDEEQSIRKKGSKKKDKKDKKGRKSREVDREAQDPDPPDDTAASEKDEEATAMPGSWETATKEREDESPAEVVDPFQYQVHDDPEDYQPSFPPTAKAPPVTSVQETNASPRRSSQSREREVEMNGYGDAEDLMRSPNRPSQSMADVASAMYEQRSKRSLREGADIGQDEEKAGSASPTEERDSRRTYDGSEPRKDDRYYEEPDTYDDTRSTATSGQREEYSSSRKSKRRSRGTDDDTISVTSSGSRRSRDSPESAKKDKKGGFFGGMFGRKSGQSGDKARSDGDSLSRQSTKESREGDDEDDERRRRRRRHTESDYGDEDDSRSVASESRRKHHHRRRTDDDEYSSSRRDEEDGDRHHHHHHHRQSTNDEDYDREQSFLEMGVEGMPPLPDNRSESEDSAAVKKEQGPGMPASAELDTEPTLRDHADAFDLVRQDEHEQPAANAFDLIRHGQDERSAANALDLIRHAPAGHDSMDVDTPEHEESQPEGESESRGVQMGDAHAVSGSGPASPTAGAETGLSGRRLSLNRPVSTTAVPLRFPFGHQPPTSSPRVDRAASFGGSIPTSPATPISASRSRQSRPTSTEIRPLYLVERNRKIEDVDDTLPSLPSSKPSSRASSQVGSDEYESAEEGSGSPSRRNPLSIDVDRAAAFQQEPDYLDSQQTTPRASEPPKPIFEKPPRQEPQFYTWEDFARDERMRSDERGEQSAAESDRGSEGAELGRSSSRDDDRDFPANEDLPALPPSRPESRTSGRNSNDIAKGIAAAGVLGGAALLARQALKDDDRQSDDREMPAEDTRSDTGSLDLDYFVDSERVMEEGEASGSPRTIYVAPSPEPNELDHFLDAEERMEEGELQAESTRNPELGGEGLAAQDQHHSVDERLPETIDEYMEAEERMEADRTEDIDRDIEAPVEPPNLMMSVGRSSSPLEQDRMESDPPKAVDVGSTTHEAPVVDGSTDADDFIAPVLTRKQSKRAKKKQKAAASRAPCDDTDAADELLYASIEGDQQTERALATDSGDTDLSAVPEASHTTPSEDRDADVTARPHASDQEIDEVNKGPIPENPVLSQDEPDPANGDAPPQEQEDSVGDIPFISRKKSKKDKKKQKQQAKDSKSQSRKTSTSAQNESSARQIPEDSMDASEDLGGDEREEKNPAVDTSQPAEPDQAVDTRIPDIDANEQEIELGVVPSSEHRDFAAPPSPASRSRPIDSGPEYDSLRSDFYETLEQKDTDNFAEPTNPEDVDSAMLDVGSTSDNANRNGNAPPPSEAETSLEWDPMTIDPANDDSEALAASQSADNAFVEEAAVQDESADEFTWTSSSKKKKGKQSKKSKQSTKRKSEMQRLPETAGAPDQDSRDMVKPSESIRTEDPASFGDVPSQTDTQDDSEPVYSQAPSISEPDIPGIEKGGVAGDGHEQERHDVDVVEEPHSRSPLVSNAPDSRDDTSMIKESSHEDPPLTKEMSASDTAPDPQESMEKVREAFSELQEEPHVKDTSLETAEDNVQQGIDPAPAANTPGAEPALSSKDLDQLPLEEQAIETGDRSFEETTKESESVSDNQAIREEVIPTAGGDENRDVEDQEFFWTPQMSKKKGKKGKKSKRAVEEDTPMQEPDRSLETDPELSEQPSAAVSTPVGDTSTQITDRDDVQDWIAPLKGKKGKKDKKSKKSALVDTQEAGSSEQLAATKGEGDAVPEDPAADAQAMDVDSADFWTTPIKDKKAKKSKKSRMAAAEENLRAPDDDIEMADNIQEHSEQRSSTVEKSADQIDEDATQARERNERSVEHRPSLAGSMQEDIASLVPLPDAASEELANPAEFFVKPSGDHIAVNYPSRDGHAQERGESLDVEKEQSPLLQPAIIEELENVESSTDGRAASTVNADTAAEPVGLSEEAKVLDEEHPTTMEPEQMAPDEEPDRLEPETQVSPDTSIPFVAKKSKKDKTKGKKLKASTTDYWADEEGQGSTKSAAENPSDQTGHPAAKPASLADADFNEAKAEDANQEEEQDWGSFSTKRSKKDKKDKKEKKKDKKRASLPIANVFDTIENEPQPSLEPSQTDLADRSESMDIDQSFEVTEATRGVVIEDVGHVDHEKSMQADPVETITDDHPSVVHDAPGLEEVLAEETQSQSVPLHEHFEMADDAQIDPDQLATVETRAEFDDPTLPNLGSDETFEPTVREGSMTENEPQDIEPATMRAKSPAASDPHRDIDFTATVAAGLADSGFDADLVMNDPMFQRRASPPGTIAEADPEEAFATVTKKRKKGKKQKRGSAMEDFASDDKTQEATSSSTPKSQQDDLNETLERTLAGSGFDTALLQRATSTDDTPSNEITGDSMFSFSSSKRKKGKKSKKSKTKDIATPTKNDPEIRDEPIAEVEREANDSSAIPEAERRGDQREPDLDIDAALANVDAETELDLQREETNTTEEPASDMNISSNVRSISEKHPDTRADLILAGEEMDVDEMDSAYRTFKKKKRDKKKQKATSTKATNKSKSESVSETEPREPEIASAESPFERDRPQTPKAISERTNAPPSEDAEYATEETRSLGPSGVQAAQQEGDREASAGAYHREADRDGQAFNELAGPNTSTSWSFANLDGDNQSNPESPVPDKGERALVRDSGYQTADSPLVERKSVDSATFNVPEIRTPQSRESLHERRSGEPLRMASGASADWDIRPSKTRDASEDLSSDTLHARTPSQDTTETPLESTTKNRASYLFQSPPENIREVSTFDDSPTPRPRATSIDEVRSAFRELSSEATREPASEHQEDRVLSPASGASGSQRVPLDTIPEERQGQKRTISETGLAEAGRPEADSPKASRRSEASQSSRSRERAFSPASLPPVTIPSGHGRSVSGPASSDKLEGRAPWSSADESHEPGISDLASKRRTSRQASGDMRSPSVMSNRSNTSASQFRSPEELRSYSRASNRSTTPSLRRVSLSGDLRAASRRGESGSAVGARASPKTIPFEAPPTPPPNDDEVMDTGASRSVNMSDVYSGYGDADGSQVSPTRPPNMRKRQSMHIMELESKVDQLVAENEALQDARRNRGISGDDLGSDEDIYLRLREKDNEINQVRTMLQSMQDEISRLNEINAGLSEANRSMVDDNNGQFAALQAEHAHAREQWENTSRELDDVRQEHGRLTSGMREVVEAEIAAALAGKNSEIQQLREELDVATERIRALQVQIQSTRSRDFLIVRDEDYFDGACQKLCQHVQQWVLRFSKLSDDRRCRLSTDLNDEKVETRLDNVVLDGSDVDKLLADRIKRRDVFMSLVMTMIWEYVFTRYLFGMDREQRKKLKDLEKMLEEVGPKRAVSQWRATTLTLLSQRPAHAEQRGLDTDAVATEVFSLLCRLLPPPSNGEQQLLISLRKVIGIAVDLSIDMRCQRAEYIMLPPLQPEYDTNGDLVQKVYFNASLMNERSGTFSSNGELEQSQAVVKIVLFPLVVKKGDEVGEGEEEIVVCPAQVLVHGDSNRSGKRIVRVQSGAMEIDDPRRSQKSLVSPGGSMAF